MTDKQIVEFIIGCFQDRCGFDAFWDEVEPTTRTDLINDFAMSLKLRRENPPLPGTPLK